MKISKYYKININITSILTLLVFLCSQTALAGYDCIRGMQAEEGSVEATLASAIGNATGAMTPAEIAKALNKMKSAGRLLANYDSKILSEGDFYYSQGKIQAVLKADQVLIDFLKRCKDFEIWRFRLSKNDADLLYLIRDKTKDGFIGCIWKGRLLDKESMKRVYEDLVSEHVISDRRSYKDLRFPRLSKQEIDFYDAERHRIHIEAVGFGMLLGKSEADVHYDIMLGFNNLGTLGLPNVAVVPEGRGELVLVLPSFMGLYEKDNGLAIVNRDDSREKAYQDFISRMKSIFGDRVKIGERVWNLGHNYWIKTFHMMELIVPRDLLPEVVAELKLSPIIASATGAEVADEIEGIVADSALAENHPLRDMFNENLEILRTANISYSDPESSAALFRVTKALRAGLLALSKQQELVDRIGHARQALTGLENQSIARAEGDSVGDRIRRGISGLPEAGQPAGESGKPEVSEAQRAKFLATTVPSAFDDGVSKIRQVAKLKVLAVSETKDAEMIIEEILLGGLFLETGEQITADNIDFYPIDGGLTLGDIESIRKQASKVSAVIIDISDSNSRESIVEVLSAEDIPVIELKERSEKGWREALVAV